MRVPIQSRYPFPESERFQMRVSWSDDEVQFLKDHWNNLSINQIAIELNRSAKAIKTKATREDLTERKTKKWSKEDIEFLNEKWGSASIESIAKYLNRTDEAVRYKAFRLGLPAFTECVDGVLLTEFADVIGIDYKRMLRWKSKYHFPVISKKITKQTNRYYVNIDEFWKWAKSHDHLIDFSKIDENILGAEPSWVKKQREVDKRADKSPLKRWTAKEEQKLIKMVNQFKFTYDDLSNEFGRPQRSIYEKLKELNIDARPVARERMNWTKKEIEDLKRMKAAGLSRKEIANKLNRTPEAITQKSAYL